MPTELATQMTNYGVTNSSLADLAYTNPIGFIALYPVGTPERSAAIDSYAHLQKLLCTAGICIAALIFLVSLCLRNPYLGSEQTIVDAEGFSAHNAQGQANYSVKQNGEGVNGDEAGDLGNKRDLRSTAA